MDARGGQGRAGSRGPDLVAQFGMVSLPDYTPGRIRTFDLRFRKPSLYPLSYGGFLS